MRPVTRRVVLSAGLAALGLLSCAAPPPSQPKNLCHIFRERPRWYREARASEQHWGVPIPIQLAIVFQESSFRARARPPRRRLLWIIPGPRRSSAYGYGQVTRETWDAYRRSTGRRWADRDDFGDVVDFIGWYGAKGAERYGIPREDAVALYLSYHEGHAGYRRGTHRGKRWLLAVAQRVDRLSQRFSGQLHTCRADLEKRSRSWWPF